MSYDNKQSGRDLFEDDGSPLVSHVFSPNTAHSETGAPKCWDSVPDEIEFNKTGRKETTTPALGHYLGTEF